MLDLARGAAVLPRDPHRTVPLFTKPDASHLRTPSGSAHRLGDALLGVPPHLCLIPQHSTDEPLHPTEGASRNLEGHRLNRFAFARAALAHHVIKEMGTRLAARTTGVKDRLECPQFLQEPFHIAGDEVKRGNGTAFAAGPTGW